MHWRAGKLARLSPHASFPEKAPEAVAMGARRANLSPERIALARKILSDNRHLRLRVWGASMLPTLWPGDVVEIANCSAQDVSRGEMVLACRDDRFYLHRVMTTPGENTFVLRGDALRNPDPPFPATALAGRVVHVERSGRSLPVAVRIGLTSRALGLLFCEWGLARRVALKCYGMLAERRATSSMRP